MTFARLIRIVSVLSGALILLSILVFYFSGPRLFRYKDRAAVDPADGLFVIMNPLRNRSPEIAADTYLENIRQKHYREAFAGLPNQRIVDLIERENRHPLESWELADRQDTTIDCLLHLRGFRTGYRPGVWGNIWVRVKKVPRGWTVTDYQAWY